MSHQVLDFSVLTEMQKTLLHDISNEGPPQRPSRPSDVAYSRKSPPAVDVDEHVARLVLSHANPFSHAVTEWQHALSVQALRLLDERHHHTSTLDHPRTVSIDAQTLEEVLSVMDFPSAHAAALVVPRSAARSIVAAFAGAVQSISRILARPSDTHHHHPQRTSLLEEAETLVDRARSAGCAGGTLAACMQAFPEDDAFHTRAVYLLDQLRRAPTNKAARLARTEVAVIVQRAEMSAHQAAVMADVAVSGMDARSRERTLSVLIALHLGTSTLQAG